MSEELRFGGDYLVYDEFGLKEVRCMACGKPIKTRQEIPASSDPSKIIREVAKHADYKEIPVFLSDGNLAFLMVCDECRFIDIDEPKAARATEQLRRALRQQLSWEGKTEEVIEEILKKSTRAVIRRAEPAEVGNTVKGV